MKHVTSLLVSVSLLGVLLPVGVSAREEVTVSSTVQVGVRASTTEAREAKRQTRAEELRGETYKHLQETYDRLNSIVSRLETRVARITAAGLDASTTTVKIGEAKTHLREAKASLDTFPAIAVSNKVLAQDILKLRQGAKDIKMHLQEAKTALLQALRALPHSSNN